MHIPVLLDEVIKELDPKPNENFVDATFGEGGHSAAILDRTAPKGRVLGIETDPESYGKLLAAELRMKNEELRNRLILVNRSYAELKEVIKENNFGPVNGILFDLGMSSWHLEGSGRGFSFQKNEPLIMRYAHKIQNSGLRIKNYLTADEIVNKFSEKELERIFREYGEERWSRRIAKMIIEERIKKPIKTTFELVEVVKKAIPRRYDYGRIHPATRVFQALRIAVNNELENLKNGLTQALEILAPAGRIAVISFHSGEDRIVKKILREKAKEGFLRILTKKPIISGIEEIRRNPRARSAKLRAAVKLTNN